MTTQDLTIKLKLKDNASGAMKTASANVKTHAGKIKDHLAKIGTIGERAEDVFFLTDRQGRALTDPAVLHALREGVTEHINLLTDSTK